MTPKRFIIVGLPRSGTTWLQTLMNSDPRIWCRGEPFDAWQIDANGKKTRDLPSLIERDAAPGRFFDTFLAATPSSRPAPEAIGLKVLFQHHPALLQTVLPERPDLLVIHVTRENRLAQFASLRQAQKTGKWTQQRDQKAPEQLEVNPRAAAEATNELATRGFLLEHYLASLPHRTLTLSYRELSSLQTKDAVLGHLGLDAGPEWKSKLMKQGANRIADRFSNADELRAYFAATGRGHWLDAEMA